MDPRKIRQMIYQCLVVISPKSAKYCRYLMK